MADGFAFSVCRPTRRNKTVRNKPKARANLSLKAPDYDSLLRLLRRGQRMGMNMRKLLLLLKPFDVYSLSPSDALSRLSNSQFLSHLENRRKAHNDAIRFCQHILQQKPVIWEAISRDNLSRPIRDVDMVVTIGGDGTLLQASHYVDSSIPILGVNSDPTKDEEVEAFGNQFDASRSTGYLCAATVANFEKIVDDILDDRVVPSELSRLSIRVNSEEFATYALNDILLADPCPAAVTRFSFRIKKDNWACSPLVNCRSSGLRISTAAGSTAAMLSAGGFQMPILSKDLQYMVREPILPGQATNLMHGLIKNNQVMDITWFSEEGTIYLDGSHIRRSIKYGDNIEVSSRALTLKIYLPSHLHLSESNEQSKM